MRRWRTTTAFLLCLTLAGVTACNPFGDDEEETTQQLVEVVRGDLVVSVSGSGNIETSCQARLSFSSGGRIDRLYVEEGDEVSKGEVLAKLDTSALELARTQAEVALTQAQLALTQAQLNQQVAEYNLKNTLDTKDALELALLKAQIDVRNAKHHLDETRDIYTWPEIKVAKADVDDAKAFLDYLLSIGPPQPTLDYAQARLTAAEAKLDAMIRSYDTEEVAIAKLQVEAAEMAEALAQKKIDELAEEIAIKELQVQVAKGSVEQARESVELACESLEQARKQLDEATITAPIDGVVASVSAEEGDIIPSPSMAPKPVIRLLDLSSMELIVKIDEIDIPGVKLGQEAIIELDAFPDAEFVGVVTTIFPVPTEVGWVVLYNVKIELDGPEGAGIKVGMSASADIIIDRRCNVLLVPSRAIAENGQGRPLVKVMVNGEIQERQVVVGIDDGLQAEILGGIREGETVIVTHVRRKSSGLGLF